MGSYHFSHFADVERLRQFSFPLFYEFLSPYRDYLCGKYNLRWTDDPDTFPYHQLVGILTVPDEEMPEMLCSGLFYINALSTPRRTARLAEALQRDGLLPESPLLHRDCAIYGWLVSPGLLQEQNTFEAADASQETEWFFCAKPSHPDLSQERIIALEDEINLWFDPPKRYGFQLVYHCQNHSVGFHLRYGELLRDDGMRQPNCLTKRTVSRPDKHIFIVYYPDERRLEIYAKKLEDAKDIVILFGKHLFGNTNHFLPEDIDQCYTLDPLRKQGRDVLVCGDVNRLNLVTLSGVEIVYPGNLRQTLHSETCLFNNEQFVIPYLKSCLSVNQATFQMHVDGLPNPRKLTICEPGTAIFRRDDGVDTIYFQWMRNRKLAQ